MQIDCVSCSSEVSPDEKLRAIIYPEYCQPKELWKTARQYPSAVVIGAIRDGAYSRGILIHEGKSRVDYLKMGTDGLSVGYPGMPVMPVYELPQLCIGVIVCMDVQCGEFVHKLIQRVESSGSAFKMIGIPAYMNLDWFQGPETNSPLNRLYVALSNHPRQDRPRCKSFIADANGLKVCIQGDCEAISWTATGMQR